MSRNRKYSDAQRLQCVLDVKENHKSLCHVARQLGTDHKVIRRWVSRYDEFGVDGLSMRHNTYSGEFKLSVLTYMYENHLSLTATAAKFGIPDEGTVIRWERIYKAKGPLGLYMENRGKMKSKSKKSNQKNLQQEDLHSEVERLRAENAYLKKLRVLVEERIARESRNEQKPSMD